MTQNTLTKKQLEILSLLYRFRFLTRNHLQSLLNHKDHRRINSWLKDLNEKQYIHKQYEPSTFIGRMTPGLYMLTTKSKNILKDNPEYHEKILTKLVRKKQFSQTFIDSYLLIADLYLWARYVKKPQTNCHFYTKNELAVYDFMPILLPNAYMVFKTPHKRVKRYFVDVLDEQMPRFVIRKRIQRYFDYTESSEWQENTKHNFPKIIFICPNERVQKYVHKRVAMARDHNYDELEFTTTTSKLLRNFNNNLNIWTEVVESED